MEFKTDIKQYKYFHSNIHLLVRKENNMKGVYKQDKEMLEEYRNKHHIIFLTAITTIVSEGIYRVKNYDIDEFSALIPEDSAVNKEFQVEIFRWAKEISEKIKIPMNILNYYKEEIELYAPGFKMNYRRLMVIIRNLMEMLLYPENGAPMTEFELMDAVGISEDEWEEIWKA